MYVCLVKNPCMDGFIFQKDTKIASELESTFQYIIRYYMYKDVHHDADHITDTVSLTNQQAISRIMHVYYCNTLTSKVRWLFLK